MLAEKLPAIDRVAYERIETTGAVWLIELRGPSSAGTLALARQD